MCGFSVKCPAEGFEWKGSSDALTGKGAWHNPGTKESLHPDLNHPKGVDPHWDYIGPKGEQARIYPDGTIEWKRR